MVTLTLVKMAIIKKANSSKPWQGHKEKERLTHSWWKCKLQL